MVFGRGSWIMASGVGAITKEAITKEAITSGLNPAAHRPVMNHGAASGAVIREAEVQQAVGARAAPPPVEKRIMEEAARQAEAAQAVIPRDLPAAAEWDATLQDLLGAAIPEAAATQVAAVV